MFLSFPNKREFLARRLRDSGLLWLLERVGRRPGLLVVTHHRIGDPSVSPYYDPVFSASPESFHAQVRYLRDNFRILRLDEVDTGESLKEPSVLIAFDDGYRDNFDTAFPILKELGVPATFIIPTAFFERPGLPWWDHVAFVLKRTEQNRITLDWPTPMTIELGPGPRSDAIWSVISQYLEGKVDDEARFRAHLEERAGVVVDDTALGRELFMTWDQVRLLAETGMSIGSHGHTHRNLARLSEDEQGEELTTSKRILEHELGRQVQSVAYPFGWRGTYSESTERQASAAGYRLAFSSRKGVNRPGSWDQFALCRLGIGFSDTTSLLRARLVLCASFGASPF